ncbi:hypothetical protein ACWDG1_37700 [Streptomyces sp. NPDC001177]
MRLRRSTVPLKDVRRNRDAVRTAWCSMPQRILVGLGVPEDRSVCGTCRALVTGEGRHAPELASEKPELDAGHVPRPVGTKYLPRRRRAPALTAIWGPGRPASAVRFPDRSPRRAVSEA